MAFSGHWSLNTILDTGPARGILLNIQVILCFIWLTSGQRSASPRALLGLSELSKIVKADQLRPLTENRQREAAVGCRLNSRWADLRESSEAKLLISISRACVLFIDKSLRGGKLLESHPTDKSLRGGKLLASHPTDKSLRGGKLLESHPTDKSLRGGKLLASHPTDKSLRGGKLLESHPTDKSLRGGKLLESHPTDKSLRGGKLLASHPTDKSLRAGKLLASHPTYKSL
ncbi:hypothetical protein RRG08_010867 [Elysia crispata]|uniref:Uncharacterized protein n=1 Tax=Elysia crispata TaxID=231223 RepID=A0AAE0XSQ3_9GAST|nr:hypothetical protein RRG08_010867 [Elysia crispata]